MFPLAGKDFPTSKDQLAKAIREALSKYLTFPGTGSILTAEGGTWPDIRSAKLDLSGARVNGSELPMPPRPEGKRESGITVGQLDVDGQPIHFQSSRLNLSLQASGVRFDFARDAEGNPMLVLKDADRGHVEVEIGRDDIQSLLLAAASAAARQHGVTIQDLQVNLQSQGPRSIGGDVRIKARKLVMSGTMHVCGRVEIDDDLVATLSNLSASGEGVIGTMASGFLSHKLKQNDGKRIPLMAFSLGDVSLHDLDIRTDRGLEVAADFGRQA